MPLPALQLLAVSVLIIVVGAVHAAAKVIVAGGFGIVALIIIFASLPFLRRHLD